MSTGEIHYKIPWRAGSSFPGHHSTYQKGGGLQFQNHIPLIDAPDPRRFDIRTSLRDSFEQIQVRVYQQTSSIPVYVIADLSASMSFQGVNSKMDVMADFVASMSFSAYRTGDSFGFVGCADQDFDPWVLPPTLNQAAGLALADKLRCNQPKGKNSSGLLHAANKLGVRRGLIFLLSDFHFPLDLIDKIMVTMANHDVVPVMLWDQQESTQLPDFGLVSIKDAETQQRRMLLMRPSLKKQIQQQFLERHEKLMGLFGQYGRLPLLLENGFDSDEVTHYFFA